MKTTNLHGVDEVRSIDIAPAVAVDPSIIADVEVIPASWLKTRRAMEPNVQKKWGVVSSSRPSKGHH